ncbi:MAG: hypothetical protein ABFD12_08865 [Syntrophorhabdus sp.]
MKRTRKKKSFWTRHSLTIIAVSILLIWFFLYVDNDPDSHMGAFFGNAIADWSGVVMTIVATKYFYEIGSKESKKPKIQYKNRLFESMHEHSLSIFLIVTGIGWCVIYWGYVDDTQGKWGTVISNMLSEWTQQLGLVLLTKKLIEAGSKE